MKSILKALASFQASCPPISKGEDNPFFKSRYATLDTIQKTIQPHLQSSGLCVTQAVVSVDGLIFVESKVWHVESGEFLSSVFPVVVSKQSAQEYGSAVSYAKRYSLSGLLNLIIQDEDDDGNRASGNTAVTPKAKPAVATELPPLTQDKYDAMVKFINDGKIAQVEAAIKKYALTEQQTKLLISLITQAKSEAVTKAAKK